MIRTSKKEIEKEIMRGDYCKITRKVEIKIARKKFKKVAYSCSSLGVTGIVYLAPSGDFYATTDKNLIDEY